MTMSAGEIIIRTSGEISEAECDEAREKIGHLRALAGRPLLFVRVELRMEPDPARQRPAIAKATLDVGGRVVRAHVASTSIRDAIDLLQARLRQQLERVSHHHESKKLRARGDEWHHATPRAIRPSHFPRPAEDRELVRHKSFAVAEATPDEAAWELDLMDLDFYLFVNLHTGEDNVLVRDPDAPSTYELIERDATCDLQEQVATIRPSAIRPAVMDVAEATALLDLANEPFVFFFDREVDRGHVLYRRYDGHYGLIIPADEPT